MDSATLDGYPNSIYVTTEEDTYPLTPMQQAMLLHTLADPEGASYTQQFLWTFDGHVNDVALAKAWTELVGRHPILRTAFSWSGRETPKQVVHRDITIPWEYRDWSMLDSERLGIVQEEFLHQDFCRGFRLEQPQPGRLALIRLSASRHLLVWTSHHIAIDGYSRAILMQELRAIYHALVLGRSVDLPPIMPFRNYADWLDHQDFEKSAGFWRELLSGHHEPTRLELTAPRLDKSSVRSAPPRRRRLSAALGEQLRSLASEYKLTLNTLFQGAWAILLSCYVGHREIMFGAVRSGRESAEGRFARVVGPLINTLPVPVTVPVEGPLLQWLSSLRTTWVKMREHGQTPLAEIRKSSPIPADIPMFDTVLAFESPHRLGPLALGEHVLPTWTTELRSRTSYPLVIRVHDRDEILVEAEYDTYRYRPSDLDRLLSHLEYILGEMAADPFRHVGDLRLMNAAEERRLLNGPWKSHFEQPRARLLHEAFEENCRRTPDAIALICGDQRLTYDELGAWSNRIADRLRREGVGPGSVVGVYAGREPVTIAAILGVLKAGGAYLPLNPQAPPARLTFLLKDAEARWLLIGPEGKGLLDQLDSSIAIINLAMIHESPGTESDLATLNDTKSADHRDLAYILYTSGTTGWPKGVAIEHRGVVSLVDWVIRSIPIDQLVGVLSSASLAFDLSVFDLFVPLSCGAKVILVDDLFSLDSAPAKEEVTLVSTVPSVMSAFLVDKRLPPSVKAVVLAGEALDARLPKECYAHPNIRDVYNIYGPTEATVFATLARVDRNEESPPPIGRPVANTRLYILDNTMHPVPEGVIGELWIGGIGLARGYVGRPEATAEAFRPDPFEDDSEARIYRTGDMVRRRDDGQLEFLGRRDHQVKIRGVRIEPSEIESALTRHPKVREAAVNTVAGTRGALCLVAYVVPEPGKPVNSVELRDHLRTVLTEAMIPSSFVVLNRLPRTDSGKVDRKSLPPPPSSEVEYERAYEPPRTPLEGSLAEIWTGALGREPVGIRDNFFELGGHSLLAMRVVARIREVLGIQLPIRDFFESPTIAGIADRLRDVRDKNVAMVAPISRSMSEGPAPLSFSQERLWFLDQLEPGTAAYNIPRGFRLIGPLDSGALVRALGEITRRHDMLRTIIDDVNGEPMAITRPPKTFDLPIEDLRGLSKVDRDEVEARWITDEATRPFDLRADLMLRGRLLRSDESNHTLLLTIHHIAADGWSLEILWRELSEIYHSEVSSKPSNLASLPIRYADYANWQRHWFRGETLSEYVTYWRSRLEGLPSLDFPTDRPRPPEMTYLGGAYDFAVDAGQVRRLRQIGQWEGVTLHITLLAVFCTLIHRLSGQEDFAIAVPSANRVLPEIQGLIGFFVNTIVLRADFSGRPSFRELLRRIRQVAIEAYEHVHLPFEKLVAELSPAREEGRNPLAQILFQLLDGPPDDLHLEGVEVKPVPNPGQRVRFDLELLIRPCGEGLVGRFLYSTDLFDAETISRLSDQYLTLLESVADSIDSGVAQLQLLNASERRHILEEWSGKRESSPLSPDFLEMFRARVSESPEAVAILSGDRSLTYTELDARTDQLSHRLRRMGVGADDRVAVYVGRSLELLVGILGVLKAGGAYVPLALDSPPQRLRFQLDDMAPIAILTVRPLFNRLPNHESPCVLLDELVWDDCVGNIGPLLDVHADCLAYVLYTSGSTGIPKGVAMPRRPLSNLIAWQVRESSASTRTRTLQYSPIGFDVSFQECFSTWCTGGTLVIMTEEERSDPIAFLGVLENQKIERLFLPFVALRELAESVRITGTVPSSLREIITAGEQLQVTPAIREFFTRVKGCTLVNQYGPTETHVATSYRLHGSPDEWPALPPIGRAISGARVYVLDRDNQPVPVGVRGEIYLGGVVAARGYHERPDLTAARFLPDPFEESGEGRMFRTGDLGRWRPDGIVEFLGRGDDQVKIRGFRIELAEIEAVLAQHPAIEGAAVAVHPDRPGDHRLVGYVTTRPDSSTSEREIKDHLAASLPSYMIPQAIVRLDELPLNTNGKIDRRALPAPAIVKQSDPDSSAAPRTQLERTLATLWAKALGLDQVGRDDDFFESGGHSLLAMRLIAQTSATLGRPVSIKLLFRNRTVARLAEALESENTTDNLCRSQSTSWLRDTHPVPDPSSKVTWERRPLLDLIACGALPPVDAAALAYLPDELANEVELTSNHIIDQWFERLPHLAAIMELGLGRVALIYLPRFAAALYSDPAGLKAEIAQARTLAGSIGARAISLTGLIPSATGYALHLDTTGRGSLPLVTTGHATTVSAVVLSVARVLHRAGRDIRDEVVGVVGLGSIGSATLRLMLQVLPHPRSLMLCDLYGKLNRDEIGQIIAGFRYQGEIRFLESRPEVPDAFYSCSLIVGATNVPEVLAVTRIRSGTIIVDDSGPHCFDVREALHRVESKRDILVTEGGVLLAPGTVSRKRHVPRRLEPYLAKGLGKRLANAHPHQITGCVLSSLLTAIDSNTPPTIGLVKGEDGLAHYRKLVELKFDAAGPLCANREITEDEIADFRRVYGHAPA